MSDDEMLYDDDDQYDELSDESFSETNDDTYLGLSASIEIRRTPSFESIQEDELVAQASKASDEVAEILGLNQVSASTLLRHCHWNKDTLLSQYPDHKDKLLSEAGLGDVLSVPAKSQNKKQYICPICEDPYSGKDTFALACSHRFCKSCWQGHLETQLASGPSSIIITKCPAIGKCNMIVHDAAWRELLSAESLPRYEKFWKMSLVAETPLLKYCPVPGCNYIMKVDSKDRTKAVKCKCGFEWCYKCADRDFGDHMPATCEQATMWRDRASSESENIKWVAANTKQCPKCHKPIEKNGGCMHMTCNKKAGGCGFEFCWLCRGDWKEHGTETGGYYSCNKYNESTAAKADDMKSDQIRTELQYYMFYWHRYDAHLQAARIADDQRRKAQERGKFLVENLHVRSQDVLFLEEATQQLARNRRVLRWSYVYAFYLSPGSPEKVFFEFIQEELEKYTDMLSRTYERKTDEICSPQLFDEWKSTVINYIRVTDSFFKKFVEGVSKGLLSS